jgi:hypothetical protein
MISKSVLLLERGGLFTEQWGRTAASADDELSQQAKVVYLSGELCINMSAGCSEHTDITNAASWTAAQRSCATPAWARRKAAGLRVAINSALGILVRTDNIKVFSVLIHRYVLAREQWFSGDGLVLIKMKRRTKNAQRHRQFLVT